MLPSNLLIARVRRGIVKPVYARLDEANLDIARTLIELFQAHVGERKGRLMEAISGYEEVGFDFRFVRGLSTLLERRCIFEAKSRLDPLQARRLVFQEASRLGGALTKETRSHIIRTVAEALHSSPEELEESLWSDMEEKLVLKEFQSLEPLDLLRYYNLCLTQTLLFKATYLEFTVRSGWKEVFRRMKQLGLMYSAEARRGGFYVAVDGALSLFKLTERYGASLAKLLPAVVTSEGWALRASIVRGREGEKRLLQLELTDREAGSLMRYAPREPAEERLFDSTVEERFARSFQSSGSGWKLTREPGPLLAGGHVLIPDFSFEKDGLKVYLEVVGFWTEEYLNRKLSKLRQLPEVDMLIAVDEKLACSKLSQVKGRVLLYDRDVPVKPIIDHLKALEEKLNAEQAERLKAQGVTLEGDILELKKLADSLGVSEEALRRALQDKKPEAYRLLANILVSETKLKRIDRRIKELPELSLPKVIQTVEAEGVKEPYQVLEALGYEVRWRGLDPEKAVVTRKPSA
ncbi:MAG: DUF790 family protein [Candidatus Bathyarchaeia archaeon]